MIPDKSAMPERQKFNILSNDLVRRMSSIKVERAEEVEEQRGIDRFTSQLKTSGYSRRKSREIVVAGVLGWMRKWRRRKEQNMSFYRGAASTLRARLKKRLLDPVNWYKAKEICAEEERDRKTVRDQGEKPIRKRKRKIEVDDEEEGRKRSRREEPKSVLFCPFTPGGELAKKLRKVWRS